MGEKESGYNEVIHGPKDVCTLAEKNAVHISGFLYSEENVKRCLASPPLVIPQGKWSFSQRVYWVPTGSQGEIVTRIVIPSMKEGEHVLYTLTPDFGTYLAKGDFEGLEKWILDAHGIVLEGMVKYGKKYWADRNARMKKAVEEQKRRSDDSREAQ